jgi:hypothetical protein
MKYCDDRPCLHFCREEDKDCKLGFKPHFKMPNSWEAINQHDWGFIPPKECKQQRR